METTSRLRKKARTKKRIEAKRRLDDRTDFDKCINLMTSEEQNEYTILLFSGGLHDVRNNTIMVGSEQYDKIDDFKNKIANKYKSRI